MNVPWLTRNVACASMLLGAVSLVAGNLLTLVNQPANGSFAATFALVSGRPGMWLLAATLAIAGSILWLPGLVAASGTAPRRGRILTVLGSLLMSFGLAVGVGHFAMFFGIFGSAAHSGLPVPTAQTLLEAEDGYVLGTVLLVVFLAGLSVGMLLLALGMRMAKVVPVWVPVAALIFTVTEFMGGTAATLVGALALLAVFIPMALAVRAEGMPAPGLSSASGPDAQATPRTSARGA